MAKKPVVLDNDDPDDDDYSSNEDLSNVQAKVVHELRDLYVNRILPIEMQYSFHKFHFPEILEAELEAKPSVLLVGQYSTGKTSFIKNLIEREYPEMHIGPEPTTDKFIAVVHGEETKTIKGNALTGVSELPFAGLSVFGSGFLNKFSAAVVDAPLLKNLTIIDTPGVLSGEKQRTSRGYDFASVCRWFAERADLILLMFDPSKLDISDEFKGVIEELQPHEEKIHCVLNKADQLDSEALMRVYGALTWSMGRVFKGAEVARVYVGSFHDGSNVNPHKDSHSSLFARDKDTLMKRLLELPKACAMRKVNEMVKRIRLLIVNICILSHLRKSMPLLWGKDKRQTYLIENLADVYKAVKQQYGLADGDFPKLEPFQVKLRTANFNSFPYADNELLNTLQDILSKDIPKIINQIAGVVNEGPTAYNTGNSGKMMLNQKHLSMIKLSDSSSSSSLIVYIFLAILIALLSIGLYMWSGQEGHQTVISGTQLLREKINIILAKYLK